MPKYYYSGKSLSGQQITGTIRASSPNGLQKGLLKRGVFLDSYRVDKCKVSQLIVRQLRKADITRITRQLAALVASGITFIEALRSVREQVSDKTLGSVLDNIAISIESGKSIAESFGQFPIFFDTLYTSLLDAGEISGTLDVSLDRIASYRERSEDVNKKIRSALAYPLLVLAVTFVVIFILVLYIIPVFASMYENFGAELPEITRRVVVASEFIQENFYLVSIAVITLVLAAVTASFTNRAKYFLSFLQLKTPLVNRLAIKIINARFAGTLGILLQSGVSMLFAVDVAINTTGNRFLRSDLANLGNMLSAGKSFTETISSYRVFSKTLTRMSAAGEKTGRLGEMLSKAAAFFESEIDHDIGTLTTLFEPMIIIFLGIFIAFILVAMYLPLFDLMNAM